RAEFTRPLVRDEVRPAFLARDSGREPARVAGPYSRQGRSFRASWRAMTRASRSPGYRAAAVTAWTGIPNNAAIRTFPCFIGASRRAEYVVDSPWREHRPALGTRFVKNQRG